MIEVLKGIALLIAGILFITFASIYIHNGSDRDTAAAFMFVGLSCTVTAVGQLFYAYILTHMSQFVNEQETGVNISPDNEPLIDSSDQKIFSISELLASSPGDFTSHPTGFEHGSPMNYCQTTNGSFQLAQTRAYSSQDFIELEVYPTHVRGFPPQYGVFSPQVVGFRPQVEDYPKQVEASPQET